MIRKSAAKRAAASPKIADSGRDFTEMMREVPMEQFVRMVTRSGIPDPEGRELCKSFKELKN